MLWEEWGVRKPQERMDTQDAELELPHCASAAFLDRPGGGSEGVLAFFFGQEEINSLKSCQFLVLLDEKSKIFHKEGFHLLPDP